jgi:hypothetical protein
MEPDEKGLFPCDKCKGEKRFLVPGKQIDENTYMAVFKTCDKCLGDGKLDWIEMAIGKKKPVNSTHIDELRRLIDEEDLDDFDDDCFEKPFKHFKPKKAPKK